jgi:M6 family metalloprotease-like protein
MAWAVALIASTALVQPGPVAAVQPSAECQLPAGGDVGAIDFHQYKRPVGTLKALMLFVDFPDAPAQGSTTAARDLFLPEAQNWFQTASYGKFTLSVTTDPRWFRMPHASTSYPYDRGLSAEDHERYIGDAVGAADSQVNFAGYDLYYFVANREATAISFSPAFVFGPGSTIHADGATIGFGATFGLDAWDWGFKVLNHETGHDFGLPDLYAFQGSDDHRYVGGWDLMGLISGHSPDYLAWEKGQFGWLTAAQIGCFNLPAETDVDLSPVETPGGVKAVMLRTADQRVTVAEYRTDRGVDDSACSTGVLVYTIDNAVASGNGPILVKDGHPGEALPDGCTEELDDAARLPGDPDWVDVANGIRIHVASVGETARVHVTRTSSYTPPDVRHARRLTLTKTGSSVVTLTGRLTSTPGYAGCVAGRSVRLQSYRSGTWVTIRTANTNAAGIWTYRAALRSARYRLVAPSAIVGSRPRHVCATAVSPTLTLR